MNARWPQFLMHDHLRFSPVYQNALQTGSILGETSADSWLAIRSRRYEYIRDDLRVESAGKKLDHLIRRALDPDYPRWIGPYQVSAIMVFLAEFDQTFPTMRISDQTHRLIEPRITFCHQIVGEAKRQYEAFGWPPPAPDGFRDFVIRSGETIRNIVYHNPFYLTHGFTDTSRLYREISACYWN